MTPHHYATTIVIPTLREFLAQRGDLRRAVLACVTIYHTADYLAQSRVPAGLSWTASKKVREVETQLIRKAVARMCPAPLAIVQGMCNGTKHADPPLTRDVPVLAYDMPGAGWDQGRWDVSGLEVEHDGSRHFVDHCTQAVVLAFRALYGTELDPLDLGFIDPIFRGFPGWQEPPTTST